MTHPNTKHGLFGTRIHQCWDHMIQRCTNPNNTAYNLYGGRGISVCAEWRTSVLAFATWAKEAGYHEGLQLDRINNGGNYCPENCRFVSRKTNTRNRSITKMATAFGETKPVGEWVEDHRCSVTYTTLNARLNRGWDVELAISSPVCLNPGEYPYGNGRKHS